MPLVSPHGSGIWLSLPDHDPHSRTPPQSAKAGCCPFHEDFWAFPLSQESYSKKHGTVGKGCFQEKVLSTPSRKCQAVLVELRVMAETSVIRACPH